MITVEMAHELGYVVVAEGVETQEQLDALLEVGVDQFQGFYLAKPMSVASLIEVLDAPPWLSRFPTSDILQLKLLNQ